MHAAGIHSALAVKRQRKRRDEARRARERRFSSHSTESGLTSPRNSTGSLDRHGRQPANIRHGTVADTKVVSSIGMLHIGVVFFVLGIFLLLSGIIPDDWSSWNSEKWFNELVATGAFALGVGIFLIILHFIISKQEEDALDQYVKGQLTRSRSGHRLERDVETGVLTTKTYRRVRQQRQDELERGLADFSPIDEADLPGVHSPPPSYTSVTQHSVEINGQLTKIIEEDTSNERLDEEEMRKLEYLGRGAMSTSTTASLSPSSETRELLINSSCTNANRFHHVNTAKV